LKEQEKKNFGEKMAKLSQVVDVATIGGVMALSSVGIVSFGVAALAIEASLATFGLAEAGKKLIKPKRK
jgi:hypothetical protein